VARTPSSELLRSTVSRARKVRGLRPRCQPWSERLITWPWNDSTQAPSACCSIAAPYHLPLHLSPPDGLHIEVALASANTKIVACRRYTMYQLLRGVSTKKRANSWNGCHWAIVSGVVDRVSRQQERNKKYVWISCVQFSTPQFGFRPGSI
jgi:hypothetical protein